MELIYSMRRKPFKCEPPRYDSATDPETVRPLCTISTANIIAFSSPTELNDVDGDTWSGHVYVCDLDTPWDSHKVTSTTHPVSALEWDITGKQLLVATAEGEVSVYGQKDYLLNDWQCLYTASFPGERIIKSAFFHNGRRVIALDKKPEAPVTERFQMLRSRPTLRGFGGVPCEGLCIITGTGLVGAVVPSGGAEGGAPATVSEALRPTRDHVTAASIAYKHGNLLISAIVWGGGAGCVRCYLCAVSGSPLALTCQPLPAVYMLDCIVTDNATISWSLREDTDSLLVGGTSLSLWKCTERANPVHKLLYKGPLQGSTTPGGGQKPGADSFNTVVWQKTAVWPIDGEQAVCIASTKLPLGAPHVVLATPRALHLLARDSHHVLCSRQVSAAGVGQTELASGASPHKIAKYGAGAWSPSGRCATISHAEMSWSGGALVCIDSHSQLHLYRLPNASADIPTPISVQHTSSILEYFIISGYDCLDLLITLKPNLIEPLYERLTESFQRQPAQFQQYYYHRWMKFRIALCRLSPALQATVSWLTCIQTCSGILSTLALAARNDEPQIDDDDDKTLVALESKPDVISDTLSLQAMRLSLQRAMDIAVTAIAQLASPHHTHNGHGAEVWSESGAVAAVRRALSVARAGEPLARALARLHAARDKLDLSEECSAIAAQYSATRVWESQPRCNVSAPHGRIWPLYLEYGVEPEALRYVPEPPAYAQCEGYSTPSQGMDSIRYMYLGGGRRAARARACGRCGARSLAHAHAHRHPLQHAHDARYLPECRCGGKWTLVSNI